MIKQLNDDSVDTIDCFGKTPSIHIFDLTHQWDSGYADCLGAKSYGGDWIGVYLGNWTDNEIDLYGFGYSNLNPRGWGHFIIEPNDHLMITVNGPNHNGVYNYPTVVEEAHKGDYNYTITQPFQIAETSQFIVFNVVAMAQQISKMPHAAPLFASAAIAGLVITMFTEKLKTWRFYAVGAAVGLTLLGLLLITFFI